MRFLYVTTKDFGQARTLAEKALEDRVAACANILPSMESLYWWQGKIQMSAECVLILKTTAELVEEATRLIKHWHTYSTPCVVALAVEQGDMPYLDWIRGEVRRLS